MTIEVKVPVLPESVTDGVVVAWHKQPGDTLRRDEALVDIETDKVVLEIPAPDDGVLEKILFNNGDTVTSSEVLGLISTNGSGKPAAQPAAPAPAKQQGAKDAPPAAAQQKALGPAARRLVVEHNLDPGLITGTGKNGRITKGDVLAFITTEKPAAAAVSAKPAKPATAPPVSEARKPAAPAQPVPEVLRTPGLPEIDGDRTQKRVPMSRLRARVAERLLYATQNTAMLTTFNEVDMLPVKTLREKHRAAFEKQHGVKLGYMSFFVRAAAEALKRHPDINASIDGDEIVYHGFCDIGVAISSDRGLVVPILRNAEYMSLAEVETEIMELAGKARSNKLTMDDITGGTFSITNGGVFGSMLSTPILNTPQSAILGMHNIVDRPVVSGGEIVIRPIMYLALTYDHRIVDGKSAVTFLVTIKELLEDPASMLLDL